MRRNYVKSFVLGVKKGCTSLKRNLSYIAGTILFASPFASVLVAEVVGSRYSLVTPSICIGAVLIINNLDTMLNGDRTIEAGNNLTFEDEEGNPTINCEDIYEAVEKLYTLEKMIERGDWVEK